VSSTSFSRNASSYRSSSRFSSQAPRSMMQPAPLQCCVVGSAWCNRRQRWTRSQIGARLTRHGATAGPFYESAPRNRLNRPRLLTPWPTGQLCRSLYVGAFMVSAMLLPLHALGFAWRP
jgi:hypothetical protein